MELDKAIKERRSVRAYLDKKVEKEKIDVIIDAGIWAPCGLNSQPWEFIIIENPELIKEISDSAKKTLLNAPGMENYSGYFTSKEDTIFYRAPALILVTCKKAEGMMREINIKDVALAIENMFLKAYDLGLGSCWGGFGEAVGADAPLLEKIGMPKENDVLGIVMLGYPAKESKGTRNPPKILNWIK